MNTSIRWLALPVAAIVAGSFCACSEDTFESIPPDISIYESDPSTEMQKLDFGSVPERIPFRKTFFVRNKIEHAMDLTFSLSLLDTSGKPASGNTVTFSPAEGIVKGGEAIPVTATFTPPAAQQYTFKMHVETNARTTSKKKFDIPVAGSGMTPKIVIEIDGDVPEDPVLDFGDVYVYSSLPKEATVRNDGTGTLTISSVSASNTEGAFQILDPPLPTAENPIKIEPKKSVLFTVTFSPVAVQAYKGTFTLNNDDATNRAASIEVLGNGVPTPVNGPPVANVVCPEGGIMLPVPGEVELDGTGSTDKDGDILTYKWSLKENMAPEGSDYCFDCNRGQLTHHKESNKDKPKFFGDLVGDYTVQLIVNDGHNHDSDPPAECVIHGYAAQQLHIELLWDNPVTDVDLHLVNFSDGIVFNPAETGGLFTCPCDCNTNRNRNPDWGLRIPYVAGCTNPNGNACDLECSPTFDQSCKIDPNDPATARNPDCYKGGDRCVLTCEPDAADQFLEDAQDDNPKLDIDDTKGYGPENINIVKPSEGLYRIFVHYFDDYGTGNTGSTVRLYINGKTKPEWKFGPKVLSNGGQLWEVALVQWPADDNDDAIVTAVDAVRDASPVIGATCRLPTDGGTDDAAADAAADSGADAGTPDAEVPDAGTADAGAAD